MITLFPGDFNTVSQIFYDRVLEKVQIHRLSCPCCGHSGCLTIHGYYTRKVRTPGGIVSIRILRVKCSCGKTHSVLLASMIPYSQIRLADMISVIMSEDDPASSVSLQLSIPDISTSLIQRIRKNFHRHWEQRILSIGISLGSPATLSSSCLRVFGRQFMQIRCTVNGLLTFPT